MAGNTLCKAGLFINALISAEFLLRSPLAAVSSLALLRLPVEPPFPLDLEAALAPKTPPRMPPTMASSTTSPMAEPTTHLILLLPVVCRDSHSLFSAAPCPSASPLPPVPVCVSGSYAVLDACVFCFLAASPPNAPMMPPAATAPAAADVLASLPDGPLIPSTDFLLGSGMKPSSPSSAMFCGSMLASLI